MNDDQISKILELLTSAEDALINQGKTLIESLCTSESELIKILKAWRNVDTVEVLTVESLYALFSNNDDVFWALEILADCKDSWLYNTQELDISFRWINSVPSFVQRLPSLKVLDVSKNRGLKDFSGLTGSSLEEIRLSKCNLQKIPSVVQTLSSLKVLDVSDNRDLKDFSGLTGLLLEEIRLSRCRLTELPVEVCGLASLKRLNISNNQFDTDWDYEIPSWNALQKLSLEVLDIMNTGLYKLPTVIGKMSQLKELSILNNPFDTVCPNAFPASLETLHINGRQVRFFVADLEGLSGLKHVYIGRGNLQRLPAFIFQQSKLQRLEIKKNPITITEEEKERLSGVECSFEIEVVPLDSLILSVCERTNTSQNVDKKANRDLPVLKLQNVYNYPTQIGRLEYDGELFNLDLNQTDIQRYPNGTRTWNFKDPRVIFNEICQRRNQKMVYSDLIKLVCAHIQYKYRAKHMILGAPSTHKIIQVIYRTCCFYIYQFLTQQSYPTMDDFNGRYSVKRLPAKVQIQGFGAFTLSSYWAPKRIWNEDGRKVLNPSRVHFLWGDKEPRTEVCFKASQRLGEYEPSETLSYRGCRRGGFTSTNQDALSTLVLGYVLQDLSADTNSGVEVVSHQQLLVPISTKSIRLILGRYFNWDGVLSRMMSVPYNRKSWRYRPPAIARTHHRTGKIKNIHKVFNDYSLLWGPYIDLSQLLWNVQLPYLGRMMSTVQGRTFRRLGFKKDNEVHECPERLKVAFIGLHVAGLKKSRVLPKA